jgi:biotin carboxylase
VRVHLIASKVTDSVVYGFLPAAARLGLDLTVLTDQPQAHEGAIAAARGRPRPGAIGAPAEIGEPAVIACDPWDIRTLIPQLAALPGGPADAVLTNSDHLQTQTALAADYFGLPGKDWRAALRAKDKVLMRRRLARSGTGNVTAIEITTGQNGLPDNLSYPLVLKPATGVASEDVVLVHDQAELTAHTAAITSRRPGERLIAEEYLPGQLRTAEVFGDGTTTWVLGGFRTDLSAPPFFVEERLTWDPPPPEAEKHVLSALAALGTPFGPSHAEYVQAEDAQATEPQLIEVNDRLIGDHCDFLLGDLLGMDPFELMLRTYLGQPLPPAPPPPAPPPRPAGRAITEGVVARQSGILTAAPRPGPQATPDKDTALTYWPLRHPGDRITVTHTNRDYLGVICAIGPDPAAVEQAVRTLRTSDAWQLTPAEAAP